MNTQIGLEKCAPFISGKEAEDDLFYHLVINTDRVSYEMAARLIADQVLIRFPAQAADEAQSA